MRNSSKYQLQLDRHSHILHHHHHSASGAPSITTAVSPSNAIILPMVAHQHSSSTASASSTGGGSSSSGAAAGHVLHAHTPAAAVLGRADTPPHTGYTGYAGQRQASDDSVTSQPQPQQQQPDVAMNLQTPGAAAGEEYHIAQCGRERD
jgi:hypothetical protein